MIQLQNGKTKAFSLMIFWTPAYTVCILYIITIDNGFATVSLYVGNYGTSDLLIKVVRLGC